MKYGFLFIISGLISCGILSYDPKTDAEANPFSSIVLIDTLTDKLTLHSSKRMTTSQFHSVYTGPLKDSVEINYSYDNSNSRTEYWQRFEKPNNENLIIYMDTTQLIGSALGRWGLIPPLPALPKADKEISSKDIKEYANRNKRIALRKAKKSYPVFIQNLSSDTLLISFGYDLPLIIEAQDSLNIWKPIQRRQIYHCGTGLYDHILNPKELIISTCPLFQGTFRTKMRIAYQFNSETLYSNEFQGSMNYSQFDEIDLIY